MLVVSWLSMIATILMLTVVVHCLWKFYLSGVCATWQSGWCCGQRLLNYFDYSAMSLRCGSYVDPHVSHCIAVDLSVWKLKKVEPTRGNYCHVQSHYSSDICNRLHLSCFDDEMVVGMRPLPHLRMKVTWPAGVLASASVQQSICGLVYKSTLYFVRCLAVDYYFAAYEHYFYFG